MKTTISILTLTLFLASCLPKESKESKENQVSDSIKSDSSNKVIVNPHQTRNDIGITDSASSGEAPPDNNHFDPHNNNSSPNVGNNTYSNNPDIYPNGDSKGPRPPKH